MKNKEAVTEWVRNGMDYNQGIALLVQVTGQKYYAGMFAGKQRTMGDKLAYELLKNSGVATLANWKDFIAETRREPFVSAERRPTLQPVEKFKAVATFTIPSDIPLSVVVETIGTKPLDEYPKVIRRMIHEYAELFQERSKLHEVMCQMPESNAESVVTKRQEVFSVIKSISNRLEILYSAKDAFDKKGTVPNEKELYPDLPNEADEQPVSKYAGMDTEELKRQKKNLQTGNSKDQTILDYQGNENHDVKTPMPNGPKRIKIEMRIQERNKWIEEIEMMLLTTDKKG
jgi:hypothetical protein